MKAQLFILGGRDVGRSFDIDDKAVLGRAPECEVRLRDRSISRKHAVVRAAGGGWVIEDLGSRNGLKLHGERVPDAPLRDHDEFELGDLPIRFRVPEAAGAPPPPLVPVAGSSASPAVEVEDEIQLEEEIELEDPAETVTTSGLARGPGLARAPVRLQPAPEDAEEPPELSEYELRRAQLLREGQRTGFFRGDLSQRPFWVRLVVGGVLTAMAVGIMLLAFWMMQKLRGSQ